MIDGQNRDAGTCRATWPAARQRTRFAARAQERFNGGGNGLRHCHEFKGHKDHLDLVVLMVVLLQMTWSMCTAAASGWKPGNARWRDIAVLLQAGLVDELVTIYPRTKLLKRHCQMDYVCIPGRRESGPSALNLGGRGGRRL